MSKYRVELKTKPSSSISSQLKRTLTILVVVFLLFVLSMVIYHLNSVKPQIPVNSKVESKGYYSVKKTFTTDRFSFTVDNNWEEALELTTPNMIYTYRQIYGSNQQGILQVHVGSGFLEDTSAYTNVMPVVLDTKRSIIPMSLELTCGTATLKERPFEQQIVSMGGTSFACRPGVQPFSIVAGEVNGNTVLSMKTEQGDIVQFVISYQNTGFITSEETFERVLATFKSR